MGSIAEQTFQDLEVVVTDDSPDDRLTSTVRRYGSALDIVYRRNETKLGPTSNCNRAWDLAKGEYVKILHHDDWFPDRYCLADWVDLLESNGEADLAFSASLGFDCDLLDGNLESRTRMCHQATREQLRQLARDPGALYSYNTIGAPSAVILRRSVTERFDERLVYLMDIDLYMAVLGRNPKFAYSRRPLVAVTVGSGLGDKVTDKALGDDRLQVFEWTYLYCKVLRRHGYGSKRFAFLTRQLRRHRAGRGFSFADCGIDFQVPQHVRLWLWYQREIRRRARNWLRSK